MLDVNGLAPLTRQKLHKGASGRPRTGQHAHDAQAIRPRTDTNLQLTRGEPYAERQAAAVDEATGPTTCRRTRYGAESLFHGKRRLITRQHLQQSRRHHRLR